MPKSLALRLYGLLGQLEKHYGLAGFDGLHRQVLTAVINAHVAGTSITNQEVTELGITSRSSTYRKIAELKEAGLLEGTWKENNCYLSLGPKCDEYFGEVTTLFTGLLSEADLAS